MSMSICQVYPLGKYNDRSEHDCSSNPIIIIMLKLESK